jgi:hypothetical protein
MDEHSIRTYLVPAGAKAELLAALPVGFRVRHIEVNEDYRELPHIRLDLIYVGGNN